MKWGVQSLNHNKHTCKKFPNNNHENSISKKKHCGETYFWASRETTRRSKRTSRRLARGGDVLLQAQVRRLRRLRAGRRALHLTPKRERRHSSKRELTPRASPLQRKQPGHAHKRQTNLCPFSDPLLKVTNFEWVK